MVVLEAESLRLTLLSYTVMFPPLPKFVGDELTDFYASIHERHPFESFYQRGESGAIMSTEARRKLEIEREHASYEERVSTDFEMAVLNAVDIAEDIYTHFDDFRFFYGPEAMLRATWPTPTGLEVQDLMRAQALRLNDDQYQLLEKEAAEPVSPSLGFKGTLDDPHRHWTLAVEPHGRQKDALFLELHMSLSTAKSRKAEIIGEAIRSANDFLYSNVVAFIQSFLTAGEEETD